MKSRLPGKPTTLKRDRGPRQYMSPWMRDLFRLCGPEPRPLVPIEEKNTTAPPVSDR